MAASSKPEQANKFEVVTTAIIVNKAGEYLILQRDPHKKRFPSRWTVPGGKLEVADFVNEPKETKEYWYNVLEKTLPREVREEAGLKISNIRYVTSLATVHEDGAPSLVISCLADLAGGKIVLQPGETVDYAWVDLKQAKKYDLIDGIYDELVMAEYVRKGQAIKWQRFQK